MSLKFDINDILYKKLLRKSASFAIFPTGLTRLIQLLKKLIRPFSGLTLAKDRITWSFQTFCESSWLKLYHKVSKFFQIVGHQGVDFLPIPLKPAKGTHASHIRLFALNSFGVFSVFSCRQKNCCSAKNFRTWSIATLPYSFSETRALQPIHSQILRFKVKKCKGHVTSFTWTNSH